MKNYSLEGKSRVHFGTSSSMASYNKQFAVLVLHSVPQWKRSHVHASCDL